MSDERKVYIVTSGDHSDYSINAVFSTRELAEEFIATNPGSGPWGFREDPMIEVWPVDVPTGQRPQSEAKIELPLYVVILDAGGDLVKAGPYEYGHGYYEATEKGWDADRRRFYTRVWARDEQHAVKIANERRVRAIVETEQGLRT